MALGAKRAGLIPRHPAKVRGQWRLPSISTIPVDRFTTASRVTNFFFKVQADPKVGTTRLAAALEVRTKPRRRLPQRFYSRLFHTGTTPAIAL